MVRFVYFDVGGVVYFDFSKTDNWDKLTKEIGINQDQKEEFLDFWNSYTPDICRGLNIDALISKIENKFQVRFPKSYSFLKDGFVSRFKQNKSIWPVIKQAKKTFGVGLITNQYPNMLEEAKKAKLLPPVRWNVVIDSTVIKLQKPEIEIFRLAEKLAKVKGNEILFVENTPEHIEAAKKLGWKTFLYDPGNCELSSKKLLQLINSLTR